MEDISNKKNGEYWKAPNGDWNALTPIGTLANLNQHRVDEHDDGTISVFPSILTIGVSRYHGYLRNGVWQTLSDTKDNREI